MHAAPFGRGSADDNVIATDADKPGERYAIHLTEMAAVAGVPAERALPPNGLNDWNDALKVRAERGVL